MLSIARERSLQSQITTNSISPIASKQYYGIVRIGPSPNIHIYILVAARLRSALSAPTGAADRGKGDFLARQQISRKLSSLVTLVGLCYLMVEANFSSSFDLGNGLRMYNFCLLLD